MTNKHERFKLFKLAKHYKDVIAMTTLKVRSLRIQGERAKADLLDHKLMGFCQYASDYLELLRELKLPYEDLLKEFREEQIPKILRTK